MTDAPATKLSRRQRLRQFHDTYAPMLVVPIGIIAAAGILVAAFAGIDAAQASAKAEAVAASNKVLLGCLNEYAADTYTTNSKVRGATVERDAAAANRDDALNAEGEAFLAFVTKLTAGEVNGPEDLEELATTLEERAAAGRALDKAQTHLDEVREANPTPDPPAVFCAVELDEDGDVVPTTASPRVKPSASP